MAISSESEKILSKLNDQTKLGDLRKIAKQIKKDHKLGMELWSTTKFFPRMLAILIMDHKEMTSDVVQNLFADIAVHSFDERNQLADWLMANQLTKNKQTVAMMESWENNPNAMQRRIYWYHQGRLRWVGQVPPDNTENLLNAIEKKMASEAPEVQWAMNFCAGWIGIFDRNNRSRCMALGEKLGLYKEDKVSKGCTPNYLPQFIEIEAGKRNLV